MADHGHAPEEISARLAAREGPGPLRDAVYGAIDGAVNTFAIVAIVAIVAGVAGSGLPVGVILALGLANELADEFSMAAGNYAGTKADRDQRDRLRKRVERHIRQHRDGELEELRQILALKGLTGVSLTAAVDAISSNRATWIETMLTEEYGLGPTEPAPLKAAWVTFAAFQAAGLLPLLPFILPAPDAFLASTVITSLTFVLIGVIKSRWSLASWWSSALETLALGGTAASIAYVAGTFFNVG